MIYAPGHAKARDLCSDHAPDTGTMRDLRKIAPGERKVRFLALDKNF